MYSTNVWSSKSLLLLILLTYTVANCHAKTNIKKSVIEDIAELKDFKKLLRTRTNVLVFFVANAKSFPSEISTFREAAEATRGFGTMVLIECDVSAERKKLCKKLKVAPAKAFAIKHYKDGDLNKNYDRQISVPSIVNFMRDPTGDLPWEEDKAGADVLHFIDHSSFTKHFIQDTRPMMVMFYVPWCGYCKRLKPQYSEAATILKSEGLILAAMDLEKQENAPVRRAFNITGFPTLIYFEHGQKQQIYEGETTKEGIIAFMRNPKAAVPKTKTKEPDWSADANSEIVHLTTEVFDPVLNDEKVLVMFYAPWCGHCKRLKPEYEKAASIMKEKKIPGTLAALDATKETAIAQRFGVKGYPTLKYFVNGDFKYEVNLREADKIVEFMRDPKEPPPPPPPEKPWEEEDGNEDVYFLNEQNFNTTLKRKKYALVMFYAPWCGHCKSTKPEFAAAAKTLQESSSGRILFGAVDCTRQTKVCSEQNVKGYPTIKYFSYLKTQIPYNGGRTKDDFVQFMQTRESNQKHEEL